MNKDTFPDRVKVAGNKKIVYTFHAIDEMNAEEEMISTEEIREVISHGEIIEDYPSDKRGHSCLMFGFSSTGRPVHVVCSPRDEFLWVITTYLPKKEKWGKDFKTRKRRKE